MRPRALLLLGAALAAGCGGAVRYADPGGENLVIRTELSDARAVLGVHAVDAQCRPVYEGTVGLEPGVTQVGIPPGRLSYLVFEFSTSSFWAGRSGSITQETLLRPRPGATYDIRVTYKNDLYEVTIRETPPRGRPRDIPLAGLRACQR
ncbi:MAG: hypothetical protein OEV81_08030 [Betaproteobacteria bacterium]|nr:hypothetical protein [Betaproteobacteria bacterium]MDH5220181.1 hypothetical protein [Betaproteobacteria bacterium]MDH5351889.1 hypothetical protein [Betaproteobacteria bacterium]